MNNTVEIAFVGFPKLKWLYMTGEVYMNLVQRSIFVHQLCSGCILCAWPLVALFVLRAKTEIAWYLYNQVGSYRLK